MENLLPLMNKLSGLISLFSQLNLSKAETEASAVGADLQGILAAIEKTGTDLTVLLEDLHGQVSNVKKLAHEKAEKELADSQPDEPKE